MLRTAPEFIAKLAAISAHRMSIRIAALFLAITCVSEQGFTANIHFLVSAVDSNRQSIVNIEAGTLNVTADGKACATSGVRPFHSIKVGFLFDTSGSTQNAFEARQLSPPMTALMEALGKNATFIAVETSAQSHALTPPTRDFAEILRFIPQQRSGLTDVLDTLFGIADANGNRDDLLAFIIFTDGDDNSSKHSLDDVVQRFGTIDLPIFPVMQRSRDLRRANSSEANLGEAGMTRIASVSGGRLIRFFDAADLEKAFDEVAASLLHTFAVTASCEGTAERPGRHNLKVKLNGLPKASVFAREEYFIPKSK